MLKTVIFRAQATRIRIILSRNRLLFFLHQTYSRGPSYSLAYSISSCPHIPSSTNWKLIYVYADGFTDSNSDSNYPQPVKFIIGLFIKCCGLVG